MSLTPLPTPPSTSDPANFATKADALVAALATMVGEINSGGAQTSTLTAGRIPRAESNGGPLTDDANSPTCDANGLLTIPAGQVAFPATQNPSADANTLDDYDEYTAASANCTGDITAAAVWKLTKIGNTVNLIVPQTQGVGSGAGPSFTFGTVIPAKYRPSADICVTCAITNASAAATTPGAIRIVASTGAITVYRLLDFTSNFSGGTEGLTYATPVSWTI